MNDVLAIAGDASRDDELVEEVARRRPREVTLVIGDEHSPDWVWDESSRGSALRDRLARLLTAIEMRTGAAVMGLVGDLRPFRGRWFEEIVDPGLPRAALP